MSKPIPFFLVYSLEGEEYNNAIGPFKENELEKEATKLLEEEILIDSILVLHEVGSIDIQEKLQSVGILIKDKSLWPKNNSKKNLST